MHSNHLSSGPNVMEELGVKQVWKESKMHEQEAQIPTSSIPTAETPFPQSTSVASNMTGLLKTQTHTQKKPGADSQIPLHSVLPPIWNEML